MYIQSNYLKKSFVYRNYKRRNKAFLLTLIYTILFLVACNDKKEEDDKVLARVNNTKLYKADIVDVVPPGTSKEDSNLIVNKYINNWVKEILIYQKAEASLTDAKKNVDKKLEDYRKSLIIYAFEKELVAEKLDTLIKEEEIENYYKQNGGNFELKNNIVRVTYVKLTKDAAKIDQVKQWCKSDKPQDLEELRNYCVQYAKNYFIDNNTWLLFDDLLKEIPIKTYNKESFLQNNRFVELQDSSSIYFVAIKGFQIKNNTSPLSFKKEKIKEIILVKRRLELINAMKDTIYAEAKKNNKFELISQ